MWRKVSYDAIYWFHRFLVSSSPLYLNHNKKQNVLFRFLPRRCQAFLTCDNLWFLLHHYKFKYLCCTIIPVTPSNEGWISPVWYFTPAELSLRIMVSLIEGWSLQVVKFNVAPSNVLRTPLVYRYGIFVTYMFAMSHHCSVFLHISWHYIIWSYHEQQSIWRHNPVYDVF